MTLLLLNEIVSFLALFMVGWQMGVLIKYFRSAKTAEERFIYLYEMYPRRMLYAAIGLGIFTLNSILKIWFNL